MNFRCQIWGQWFCSLSNYLPTNTQAKLEDPKVQAVVTGALMLGVGTYSGMKNVSSIVRYLKDDQAETRSAHKWILRANRATVEIATITFGVALIYQGFFGMETITK